MKDEQIERLLRERPEVPVPPYLRGQLRSQINIERQAENALAPVPLWRRWGLAWSVALLMVACVVVIAMQTRDLVAVRGEIRSLEAQLESQRAAGAAPVPATDASAELASRIEEAQNLRDEIGRLKQQILEAQQLKSETEALRAQIAAVSSQATPEDPFAMQKAKEERVRCINNLKQIGLASRMWMRDHSYVHAPNFEAMQKELKSPALLVCPSDAANLPAAQSWELFDPQRVSYEWLAPNHPEGKPEQVIARCRIHSNAGNADGSAQMFDPNIVEYVIEDGVVKLRRKSISYE